MWTRVITAMAEFLLEIDSVTATMLETNCLSSVDAIWTEWRALSHSSFLGPAAHPHRRRTQALQLGAKLCPRADDACGAGRVEQAGLRRESTQAAPPDPSRSPLMLAKLASNLGSNIGAYERNIRHR